jgi:probable DNA metabolism protein
MNHKIFICDNSIEGIFSGVFEAWKEARTIGHSHCKLETRMPQFASENDGYQLLGVGENMTGGDYRNFELFSEYVEVEADEEKARKVTKAVCDRLGFLTYQGICKTIAAEDKEIIGKRKNATDYDKGDAVYRTIVCGFSMQNGEEVLTNLGNPYVARVFELARRVDNEIGHWREFLRFKELKNGILFAKIGPLNNILPMLMPHFTDRLPLEDFMIYDDRRELFAIHKSMRGMNGQKTGWVIVRGKKLAEDELSDYSDSEVYYEELFTAFCHSITIEERRNKRLQQQMLPLKFRNYMVEFE